MVRLEFLLEVLFSFGSTISMATMAGGAVVELLIFGLADATAAKEAIWNKNTEAIKYVTTLFTESSLSV